jgi:hypothetical protein
MTPLLQRLPSEGWYYHNFTLISAACFPKNFYGIKANVRVCYYVHLPVWEILRSTK